MHLSGKIHVEVSGIHTALTDELTKSGQRKWETDEKVTSVGDASS